MHEVKVQTVSPRILAAVDRRIAIKDIPTDLIHDRDLTGVLLGKPGCAGVAPIFSNPTTLNFEPGLARGAQ